MPRGEVAQLRSYLFNLLKTKGTPINYFDLPSTKLEIQRQIDQIENIDEVEEKFLIEKIKNPPKPKYKGFRNVTPDYKQELVEFYEDRLQEDITTQNRRRYEKQLKALKNTNSLANNIEMGNIKNQVRQLYLNTPVDEDGKKSLTINLNPDDSNNLAIVKKAIETANQIRTAEYNTTVTFDYGTERKYRPLHSINVSNISDYGMIVTTEASFVGSDLQVDEIADILISITITLKKRNRQRNHGAFFPYLNKTNIDLTRYDIHAHLSLEEIKVSCFVKALKHSNVLTQEELKALRSELYNTKVPQSDLNKIANKYNLTIHLKVKGQRRIHGNGEKKVKLGLVENHYFINEKTNYTHFTIKNYHLTRNKPNPNNIVSLNPIRRKNQFIDSYELINSLLDLATAKPNIFENINLSTENVLSSQYYSNVDQEVEIVETNDINRYCRVICEEKQEQEDNQPICKQKGIDNDRIYFADFETTTEGDKHISYMCVVQDIKGNSKTFVGNDIGYKLLEFLPSKSLIYFHNLGYDYAFIKRFLCIQSDIKTGSQIKTVQGSYKNKLLTFKDSYAIISEPLREFPEMFNLKIKKEIMPYTLYTNENVNKTTVPLEEALTHLKEEDKKDFVKLAEELNTVIDNQFLLMTYAEYYCKQDVNLLREGFLKFQSWIYEAFQLRIEEFISIPSLAKRYFVNSGVFDGIYEVSGPVRIFLQKCIKGGRVMTCQNKMIESKQIMQDFDAVALYPSAMSRMGFLKGMPNKIEQDQLNLEFLSKQAGYFIEVTNVKINKPSDFPLQSEVINGIRNYSNYIGSNLFLDKISTEDFIKYQHATFDIVRGYYFNSGLNYKIQDVIKHCFNTRLQKKAEKNSIEQVYKLLMNSAYGKLIQKPIKTKRRYTNTKEQHEKFLDYNHNFIKEYTEIAKDKYQYDLIETIDKHYNIAHVGSEILSMSKRIMNEVMCLAEDNNILIYYQDTDSMHILDKDIPLLAKMFQKEYGRQLIGPNMGQFHSDFKRGKHAVRSIFLGKKCYLDVLDTGTLHIRMKGINKEALENHPTLSTIQIYEKLYDNETLEFDLAKNKVMFKRSKALDYTTVTEFKRTLSFHQQKLIT